MNITVKMIVVVKCGCCGETSSIESKTGAFGWSELIVKCACGSTDVRIEKIMATLDVDAGQNFSNLL